MCNPASAKTCVVCLLACSLTCYVFGHKHDHHDDHFHGNIDPHGNQTVPATMEASTDVYKIEPDYFLNKLLKKYGNGIEISNKGFRHLLCHLGLGGRLVLSSSDCANHSHQYSPLQEGSFHDHNDHEIHENVNNTDDHQHHVHDHELHEGHNHHEHADHDHSMDTVPSGIHDSHDHENHDHSHDSVHNVPSNNKHVGTSLKPIAEQTTVPTTKRSQKNKNGKNTQKQNISTAMPTTQSIVNKVSKEAVEDHINQFKNANGAKSGSQDKKSERKRHAEDSQCLGATSMLHLIGVNPAGGVTAELFKTLCPVLVYQIDTDACHALHEDLAHRCHLKDDGHGHDHHDKDSGKVSATYVSVEQIPAKVWGFSCVAVFLLSLMGLLGVAVLPFMHKVFYNHILLFLVALAVGALTGDALLHLLPHAIGGFHEGEDHSHNHGDGHSHDLGPIYKGLCGLLGIFFFFIIERVLTILTAIKRRRKKQKYLRRNYREEPKDVEQISEGLAITDTCDAMMINIHPNRALQGYADEAHSEHCKISFENSQDVTHHHDLTQRETNVDGNENSTMIQALNGTHKHSNEHGHLHGHGHSHAVDGIPTSVSAVAWMVILGDGIHNFADGLVIGAAFVSSITGGFSTAIAVFFHEVPHKIGDFAMLLRGGMSAKQALFYNCVSSVLCFVGMVIGVLIGNIAGVSLWIFTVVAGMFLYIALVDMLPELSSVETKKGENPFCHLVVLVVGMLLGGGIMFIIAVYEENLKTLLE
ncbi:zinc transporter ZIP10-like isoform X2 [Dreissena polymorpha]|uniref:Zinc transporter ZIP10 n=2 Tax=Dreissena polymorpha TaxID=45954 RepID=A0A9D4E957_DREPO|nr:zinc transporter ZIP10-like isoform X2 [Dreissena polymorpha]XP_052232682.1 zinc transporter ZIP10-like isoform X2 [Dreissena polymorpha]KAH3775078.1 hypothetical protein DPMN_176474 [Dreissena polymorpha]